VTRVVIDTNVFISSFFGGNPRRVIDLWKSGDITLCLSKGIVDEYVGVLERLGMAEETELEEILKLFSSGFHTLFTAKTPELHVVHGDPKDDMFIECAVALHAPFIISGDKAVLAVREYMRIKILTPKQFLDLR
jgi:putative PIN family toxin of toxin-antitoxin system